LADRLTIQRALLTTQMDYAIVIRIAEQTVRPLKELLVGLCVDVVDKRDVSV
jgi:hypothetical protein